jgi:thiol-disulfide isomerase/thioredoxin
MNSQSSWPASAARCAALAWLAGCLVGCGKPGTTGGLPWIAIETSVVDRAAYDAVVAGQSGKVVLVDFWATWCGPCLEQLPHSVELAEKFGDKLAVVTVSMDDPAEAARVQKKLLELGAAKVVNLISEGTGPRGMEAFEIDGGALPHYKLYNRTGKLRRTFALDPTAKKQFTPADVAAAVAELVSE